MYTLYFGRTVELSDNEDMVKSFELFRKHVDGVTIMTFDELFGKVRKLVNLIEG